MNSRRSLFFFSEKIVADIGCGTGILAIMASKLGARKAIGLEIEDWSVENARENVEINLCKDIKIYQGKISENQLNEEYDIVLANINKNVLLDELPAYREILNKKGKIILSGFYEEDIIDIEKRATEVGLIKISYKVKENWAAVLFQNN